MGRRLAPLRHAHAAGSGEGEAGRVISWLALYKTSLAKEKKKKKIKKKPVLMKTPFYLFIYFLFFFLQKYKQRKFGKFLQVCRPQ